MSDERNYYVLCGDNCRFESMTKEQILTAITNAVQNGTVGDIDTGFVSTIKTVTGLPMQFFVGTQAEYDALSDAQKTTLFAVISDDTTKSGILTAIENLQNEMTALCDGLNDGTRPVKKAEGAVGKGNCPDDAETEDGKAFVFSNTNGFGVTDAGVGYFKLWELPNRNGDYRCMLVPSKNGEQDLGSFARKFDRVYSSRFVGGETVGIPGSTLHIETPGLYVFHVRSIGDGEVMSIFMSIPDLTMSAQASGGYYDGSWNALEIYYDSSNGHVSVSGSTAQLELHSCYLIMAYQ